MSKKCDDFGVQSVVPSWNFFVSSVKYASGATRRPTDPPGARDACIGIHETFPAGVLARGTGIDYAVSHIATSPASRFSHQGLFVSSRAGGRVRLAQAAALRLDLAAWGTLCYLAQMLSCRGWAHAVPFLTSSSPALRCRRAQRRRDFLTLSLVRPTTPVSVGTMFWIAARHVKLLFICVRSCSLGATLGDELASVRTNTWP